MKLTIFLSLASVFGSVLAQEKRDTLFFEQETGNYIVEYYVEEEDTLVRTVFEPATKIDPEVRSWIQWKNTSNEFVYHYAIKNRRTSKQNLLYFQVEYFADISDLTTNRWSVGKIFETHFDGKRVDIKETGRWFWAGDQGLEPTWETDGFALLSKGLPGIVNAYFAGKTEPFIAPYGGPGIEVDQQLADLQIFPANRVIRKTVGPVTLPEDISHSALIDTLVSYKHQAFDLGWIRNKGIVNSLDQKLENAKAAFKRGNQKAGKNIIEAFLKEVEAQKEKHLSPEAYSLLKFNADFLLSRL